MRKDEILDNVKRVEGIGGMTVNERLFLTGLWEVFEEAKKNDKELARFILEGIQVDKQSIDKILI